MEDVSVDAEAVIVKLQEQIAAQAREIAILRVMLEQAQQQKAEKATENGAVIPAS